MSCRLRIAQLRSCASGAVQDCPPLHSATEPSVPPSAETGQIHSSEPTGRGNARPGLPTPRPVVRGRGPPEPQIRRSPSTITRSEGGCRTTRREGTTRSRRASLGVMTCRARRGSRRTIFTANDRGSIRVPVTATSREGQECCKDSYDTTRPGGSRRLLSPEDLGPHPLRTAAIRYYTRHPERESSQAVAER